MLEIGYRLGPYEIVAPLGAGGMGEVYRALDTKLDREVALKVLPEAFTADADRLARFEREAKVLASLNHPHIGQIYGLEECSGDAANEHEVALVLELVEGPTLQDRIGEGPIPPDEAILIARQIAEALAAAHDQGVIHRDLKPANVKVRPDGTVKVLDFGLAKALESDRPAAELSESPTLTARATQMGVILGTAAYMAPEQARGKAVDRRADVFAFGALLYEMLTGRRAFEGTDVTDTMASVLRSEPDWEALPRSTPSALHRLLRRCLEKSPDRRLRDLGDARLDLEDALSGAEGTPVDGPTATHSSRRSSSWIAVPVAAGLALALGFLLGRFDPSHDEGPRTTSAPSVRAAVSLPDSARLALGSRIPLKGFDSPAVSLSPDGRHLVYVGQSGDGSQLFHRELSSFDPPRAIPGTEGALHATFSPDSAALAFLTADRLRRVPLDGGSATTLCRAGTPVSVFWEGDTVFFSVNEGRDLHQVPAAGGDCTVSFHENAFPGQRTSITDLLPGARNALVAVNSLASSAATYAEIHVQPLDGGDARSLGLSGFEARYVASGHLVFARGSELWAAPFDLDRRELTGDAAPVLEGVAMESVFGAVHADFAPGGTAAFVPGGDLARGRLAWVDRQGREGWLDVPDRVYNVFDVASDERRFALQVVDVQDYVSIWDSSIGGEGRALPMPASAGYPIWSPDGRSLALIAWPSSSGQVDLLIHQPSGGADRLLLSADGHVRASSWNYPPQLAITDWRGTPRVGVLDVQAPEEPRWIESETGDERESRWGVAQSPDGGWVAYVRESSERYQVWLAQLEGDLTRQVSTDGGLEPVWSASRDEIVFRQGQRFLASRVSFAPDLEVAAPELVFEAPGFVDTPGISFRLSADGDRLYYVRRTRPAKRDRIHVVQNWFAELERLAPSSE